ncbi:SAM-dependent methyltransferase [Acidiferrobacter sp.]|jgi:SAM-dependent MidA family methyltransferase|uniref:class I SAM-dependent methyltransferase n=1 Tax=Acidiferrobacter sp. TaxID=1872107 RepID=UPI002621AB9D|nr:SAM-dependent methyltransferase [Acidiferrobacter sp.]
MPHPPATPWATLASAERATLARHEEALDALLARGPLSFIDYMGWALYDRECGYYAAREVFGAHGDFVTAPLLSTHMAEALARQWAPILADRGGAIMEVGSGNGQLAVDTLRALGRDGRLPDRYWMIERSARRRAEAQARVARDIPEWAERVSVVADWPDDKAVIIVANELLDALPAQRFRMRRGQAHPLLVARDDSGALGLAEGPADLEMTAALQDLALADGYESEVLPGVDGFLKQASEHLARGVILLIDYGFPRAEFYHPQRHQGTLMCHFRQHAHPDPLILPGLQDITVHVDFTAAARGAIALGLDLAGYTSQGAFLLALGIGADMPADEREALRARQAIKRLTLPHEMGELFKVIAFSRGLDAGLQGFSLLDRRRSLAL